MMKPLGALVLIVAVYACACDSSSPAASAGDAGPQIPGLPPPPVPADLNFLMTYGCASTYDEQLVAACADRQSPQRWASGTCFGLRTIGRGFQSSLMCVYDAQGRLVGGEYCTDDGPNPCRSLNTHGCDSPSDPLVCPSDRDGGAGGDRFPTTVFDGAVIGPSGCRLTFEEELAANCTPEVTKLVTCGSRHALTTTAGTIETYTRTCVYDQHGDLDGIAFCGQSGICSPEGNATCEGATTQACPAINPPR